MATTGIRTYLPLELAKELARLARAQGRSESSVIAEAVAAKIAGHAASPHASETQKRQLNRLEARFEKLMRDQTMLKEALLVFVRVWLEHNPPLDDELAESLAASAENRFERFLDLVLAGLRPGRSIGAEVFDPANHAAVNGVAHGDAANTEAAP